MTAEAQELDTTWSVNAPAVRKAIAFIKRKKGGVTADELVQWDLANGRRLFTWADDEAARQYRLHEARKFLNSFRAKFDGMRVRAFIHVHKDEDTDIPESAYFTVESIAAHPGMREQVMKDITNRMKALASELAMWKLTHDEQSELFARLRDALAGRQEQLKKTA
jgi:hypothetical protein